MWRCLTAIVAVAVVVVASACKTSSGPASPGEPGDVAKAGGSAVTMLAAGRTHVCALRQSGEVWCWGSNAKGQRGDGARQAAITATRVNGFGDAVEIAAGDHHTCVRRRGGSVMCWGDGSSGQLGQGQASAGSPRPVLVRGIAAATEIVAGGDQTCARESTGIRCWGSDRAGQLGGQTPGIVAAPRELRAVRSGEPLVFGRAHACVLRGDRSVLCWGDNAAGQLGDGTMTSRSRAARVVSLPAVETLAAFDDRTCGASGSAVYCWGRAAASGDAEPRPRRVDLPAAVKRLELGRRHTCATLDDGRVACFGANDRGQLGNGNQQPTAQVAIVGGLAAVRELAVVSETSCVVLAGADVRCWGSDADGVLGNGLPAGTLPHEPARVAEVDDAIAVASGDDFSCAVRRSGQLWCWGGDRRGQLGDGPATSGRSTPRAVAGLEHVVGVATGSAHTCAVDRRGDVHCFGDNAAGQCVRDKRKRIDTPVKVGGLHQVKAVALGERHSCALQSNGSVSCWGDLPGRGDSSPTTVAGLSGIVELTAGARHTCARAASGRAWCWGENLRGQIGDGTGAGQLDEPVLSPRPVARLTDAVALAGGGTFGCAVRRDGKVSCWGDNADRQLGSGTASDVWTTPVPVRRLSGMRGVAAGRHHVCAHGAGKVVCWGRGEHGELGVEQDRVPEPGPSVPLDVVELAVGAEHSCARLGDGAVACWGDDQHGQLGVGARGPAVRPQRVRGL